MQPKKLNGKTKKPAMPVLKKTKAAYRLIESIAALYKIEFM